MQLITSVYVLGKLVAGFCPSVSGCRAVVEFKDATDMQSIVSVCSG